MFNSWRHGSCFEAFNELSRDMAVAGRDCYQMIFLFQYICNTEQSLAFCSSLTSFKYCSEVLLELSMLSLKFVLLFSLSKLKCSENSERGGGKENPSHCFSSLCSHLPVWITILLGWCLPHIHLCLYIVMP